MRIETKDDQLKELQVKTERHDEENLLKNLNIDNNNYKKKYKSLNKKKTLLIITEVLVGTASAIGCSTMGSINSSAGIIISSNADLLTSIAILITNEYKSKIKIG